ncbi:hypothetical protein [Endozoicomonas sp. ONNA1]|uniref:hypothetical protein n=1 Tax=Endozoicomonas sp. ONNA1 TaxID=2828740 RepID=UPI0021495375|nr:hypothetical protein [Endozoicomonas sp. ONNA1]
MRIFVAVFLSVFLVGCASTSYNLGRDFSSEKVKTIESGVTTTEDLVSMFGEPYGKTVISSTQEKWLYTYIHSTADAQSYLVKVDVKTTGVTKTLDVLIDNGVVENYAFTENKTPSVQMQ